MSVWLFYPMDRFMIMTLYSLGLKSGEELDKILEAVSDDKAVKVNEDPETYDYEDFLGATLKLVNASDYYVYDDDSLCGKISRIMINMSKIW